MGRAIGDDLVYPPTIVTGDLNDVAWSHTTRLFLRLSGLLDPRIGAASSTATTPSTRCSGTRWIILPFYDFRLIDFRRLHDVGSDHFPMYLALSYEPAREQENRAGGRREDPSSQEMVERT